MENPLAMLRVLVAEDEYFIAQDITNSLALLGATVVGPVSSGNKALRAIAELDIDAAVLDLNLEGTIDFAVADELTRRNLPFVFATGYDPAVIPPRFARIGLFEKPFDTAELARHLLDVMRDDPQPGASN